MKPRATMSWLRSGSLTLRRASRTCSWVTAGLLTGIALAGVRGAFEAPYCRPHVRRGKRTDPRRRRRREEAPLRVVQAPVAHPTDKEIRDARTSNDCLGSARRLHRRAASSRTLARPDRRGCVGISGREERLV